MTGWLAGWLADRLSLYLCACRYLSDTAVLNSFIHSFIHSLTHSLTHSVYLNQTNGPYILEKWNRSKTKLKLIQKCMRTYAPHKLDNYIIVATLQSRKRMSIIMQNSVK